MKKLLLSLLLIPSISWAGITQIIVTRVVDKNDVETYSTQSYGLTDDGSAKLVIIDGAAIGTSKVKSFYGHYSLAREIVRFIIYFNNDNSVNVINFQLADPFQNLTNRKEDSVADSDLATLKAYIEAQLEVKIPEKGN